MQRFTEYFTLTLLAALLLWANEVPRFSGGGASGLTFDGYGIPFIYGQSSFWRSYNNIFYSSSQKARIDVPCLLADIAIALLLIGAAAWRLRKRGARHPQDGNRTWYRINLQFGLSSLILALAVLGFLLWMNTWEFVTPWPGDGLSGRQSWVVASVKGWPFPYEVVPLVNLGWESVRYPPLVINFLCAIVVAINSGLLWECYILRREKPAATSVLVSEERF